MDDKLHQDLLQGNRRALAKAITLIESSLGSHQQRAQKLLQAMLPHSGKSIRIGISGPPGVGKSTFIEAFGMLLISLGKKVAILAVDPSSPRTGGSILGDKTRMELLSREKDAFIRPSPSSGTTGGVAYRTRECMYLCEASGFDVIIVETVGVGQSEYQVSSMVDMFLVLLNPNSGDELQGIKKGIIELADGLVINKADGNLKLAAEQTKQFYTNALSLLSHRKNGAPAVTICSALTNKNLDIVWHSIQQHIDIARLDNVFATRRAQQNKHWMEQLITNMLNQTINSNPELRKKRAILENQVVDNQITALSAAEQFVALIRNSG